mgnify:CR=1 FL=1
MSGLSSLLSSITPDAIRRRFALKFFIALLCIGVIVGGVGVAGTTQIQSAFKQQVDDRHADIAEEEAQQLAGWNQQNLQFVSAVANTETVKNGDDSEIQQVITAQMRNRGVLGGNGDRTANFHYVDLADGTIEASTRAQFVDANVDTLNVTAQQALQSGETTVTPGYQSASQRGDPSKRIAYVSPIPERDGVVFYTIPLNRYSSRLESSSDSVTFVVDAQNQVLFRESGGDRLVDYGEDNGVAATARTSQSGGGATTGGPATGILSETSAIGGDEYVVGYAQIPNTDWVVLVHTSVQTAYGIVRSVVTQGLIATLAGVAVIGIIGAVIGHNISRSLDRLRGKAETMQAGDLDVDIESDRIDSIGQLYDGFAAMRDSLREQIEDAQRARKEAEVARAEAIETNDYLVETAEAYSTVMDHATAGDLTQRMATDGENDAMDAIATDFNAMIAELEKTIGQLETFADQVEESGRIVDTSAASVRQAAEQVAESIQTISDDADQQREGIQTAAETVDDAIAALDEGDLESSRAALDTVATHLDAVAEHTDETMTEAETVAGAAEEQAAELNEVSEQADKLVRYVQPLADVIGRFETDEEHEFVFTQGPTVVSDGDD